MGNVKNKKYILHIGINGFPFGSAAVNHSSFICKAIQEGGTNVLILNNRAVHKKEVPVKIEKNGKVYGIEYKYTTFSQYRLENFFKRNFDKIWGRFNELFLIIFLRITGRLKSILLYLPTNSFVDLVYYRIISKILFIPIVLNQTEYFSEINRNKSLLKRFQDYLFDKYSFLFTDGYLLISEFLISKVIKGRTSKPFLKIPPLVDPNLFTNLIKESNDSFVFCASTAYLDVILFVIDSFELVENDKFKLILIVNGETNELVKLKEEIEKCKKKSLIIHLENLPYKKLLKHYLDATALLIPLRPIIQDKARFPQKIAEYLISGNPILTTNNGEVVNYFINNINAIIVDEYDVYQYSIAMSKIINNMDKAKEIGQKGKEIGLKYFNYSSYSKSLNKLFLEIL